MKDVATQTQQFHSVNVMDELVANGCLEDDDMWISHREGVSFRPIAFNTSQGGWTNILRMAPGTQMPRHYHTAVVHGFTLQGEWRYLEHDWTAPKGTYIMEPPGEAHTLVCDADQPIDMMTFFITTGCLIYTDVDGNQTGFEDVFTRMAKVRAHFEAKGMDQSVLEGMIR
ncbi:MAG: 2,4'-dihydroxyacetophenone dioxygenase family protein [Paracoccaceae bacterium]